MKKNTKIEIFFWLVVFFVFSPRFFLEIYEIKLKKSLTPFSNNEWTIKDKNENVLYEKISLPYDIRWKEKNFNRKEYIYEKEFNINELKNFDDLTISLGQIGDADYVDFNDCRIGSFGVNPQNHQITSYEWSKYRKYRIPGQCIKSPVSKIRVHIFKVGGPGFGIYAGQTGFGNYSQIERNIKIIEYIKYDFMTAYAMSLIIFAAVQYLFIFMTSDMRESYGILAGLAFSVGMFIFFTSSFFLFSTNYFASLERLLFSSGLLSTILFLKFFNKKFGVFSKKLLTGYVIISSIIYFWANSKTDPHEIYTIYEYWHPIFLFSFLICYFQMLFKSNKSNFPYYNKYLVSFSIFIICCVHDVIVSVFSFSNSYMIGYAFTFFIMVIGLVLSREYSDAFSKVEDLVVQRTNQLNSALAEVQDVQRLKDEQARRFAHDIRSPLAALQVLKDVASHELSADAKSLFRHTIVRINDLANTALPKLIGHGFDKKTSISAVFLWPILDKIVSEKRLEYGHLKDLIIDLKSKSQIFELHCKCEEVEFTRLISNLINNSIEARFPDRAINIQILINKYANNQIEIQILDNGKGVPHNFVDKVFEDGFTHGKQGGKGIGLSHAKQMIELWSGTISVESSEDKETTIKISIPASDKPEWLLTELKIRQNLVIIDDQPFVVDAWKQKLQNLGIPVKIFWVQNRQAWDQSEASNLDKNQTLYLVDQDLSSSVSGLDMIKQLKLGPFVILVTGNDDDLSLRKRAQDLGIAILPKSLIHEIPVIV